jgi:predicted amidohydrolase YtcJ
MKNYVQTIEKYIHTNRHFITSGRPGSQQAYPLQILIFISLFTFASPILKSAPLSADTVLTNAYVYTVNKNQAVAEAVAIESGRIIYVGDSEGALQYVDKTTNVIDLEGRMLMPGINDGHLHFLALGTTLLCSLNYEALTMAMVVERISACIEQSSETTEDSLLTVSNWAWQKVQPAGAIYSKDDLDKIPTRRPIAVRATNTHVTLVNSAALKLAGITDDTPDPVGGKIQRDEKGVASGVLVDAAQQLVLTYTTPMTTDQTSQAVKGAIKLMNT